MRGIDILILAIVAAAFGAAVLKIVRDHKRGGCCGDCRRCAGCINQKLRDTP